MVVVLTMNAETKIKIGSIIKNLAYIKAIPKNNWQN